MADAPWSTQGLHTVTVEIPNIGHVDHGNPEATSVVRFEVNAAPEMTITSPPAGPFQATTNVSVTWAMTENVAPDDTILPPLTMQQHGGSGDQRSRWPRSLNFPTPAR